MTAQAQVGLELPESLGVVGLRGRGAVLCQMAVHGVQVIGEHELPVGLGEEAEGQPGRGAVDSEGGSPVAAVLEPTAEAVVAAAVGGELGAEGGKGGVGEADAWVGAGAHAAPPSGSARRWAMRVMAAW